MLVCFLGKLAQSRGGTSAQMGSFHTHLANLPIWISSANFIISLSKSGRPAPWNVCLPWRHFAARSYHWYSFPTYCCLVEVDAYVRFGTKSLIMLVGVEQVIGSGSHEQWGCLAAWCGWQMQGNLTCKWLYTKELFKTAIKQLSCCNCFDCASWRQNKELWLMLRLSEQCSMSLQMFLQATVLHGKCYFILHADV